MQPGIGLRRLGEMSVRSLLLVAAIVASIPLVAACGRTAVAEPGVRGTLAVSVDDLHGGSFFNAVHRARLISRDGAEVGSWELKRGAAPVELAAGTYRLEAFTVFMSDWIRCPEEPGATCFAPTLEPITVCAINLDVRPGAKAKAVFTPLPDGLCRLESANSAAT